MGVEPSSNVNDNERERERERAHREPRERSGKEASESDWLGRLVINRAWLCKCSHIYVTSCVQSIKSIAATDIRFRRWIPVDVDLLQK